MNRALTAVVAVVLAAAPAAAQVGRPTLERDRSTVLGERSIAGSYCTTADPFLPGGTATQCWTCVNGGPTTSPECFDQVALGYADGWTVACGTQDPATSGGSPVAFDCSAGGQNVTFSDTDGGDGEVCPPETWSFCVDVTVPASATLERCVFYTLSGDGAGGAPHDIIDCEAVFPAQGSIVVIKQTDPADAGGQQFAFAGDLGAFSLTGGGASTFTPLLPGRYDVTETLPAGWDLSQIACVDPDGGSTVDLATGTASIDLDHGEEITCTFVNTALGAITITKETSPQDAGAQQFAFAGDLGAFALAGGASTTVTDLAPGSYDVVESLPAGWDLTEITCVDPDGGTTVNLAAGSAAIDLDAGEQVACTFLNTEAAVEPGTVTIAKQTVPADAGGQQFAFAGDLGAFTLTGGGSTTVGDLEPGTYAVTETLPAGWELTDITCVDPDGGTVVNVAGGSVLVDVDEGETVTCTFLNTEEAAEVGSLTIVKQTVPADAGGQQFAFAGDLGAFTLAGGGSTTFADLQPGTYDVVETLPAGWNLTGITCVDPDAGTVVNLAARSAAVDVDAGESITCTFVNTEAAAGAGSVTIVKEMFPADFGPQMFDFTGDLGTFAIVGGGSATFDDLAAGSYRVSEAVPFGWVLEQVTCADPDGGSTTDVVAGNAFIDLDAGENVVCTFVNVAPEPGEPSLTIVKQTLPVDSGGQRFAFAGDLGDFSLAGGERNVVTGLQFGRYDVTETPPPGWELVDIRCNDPNSSVNLASGLASIQFDPGDQVVCTFVNQAEGYEPPVPIPTLSRWSLLLLITMLAAAGVLVLRLRT